MVPSFEQAADRGSICMFEACLRKGLDHHSTWDTFGRTPMFGLRHCAEASVDDFVVVLKMFVSSGADVDHTDAFGNTLLLTTENDSLGAALVRVGAKIRYNWKEYTKRGLANAAVYGCTSTIDAIMLSREGAGEVNPSELDSSLDHAAKILAFNEERQDMSGIVKLVVDYGANPNTNNTLHYSVKSNHVLVQTLVSLGASATALAWDFGRGCENAPLHRLMDIATADVFEALVSTGTCALDVNARDSLGATPLMAIMKTLLYSDHATLTRMNWLLARGASCLPFDRSGKRVSQMIRGKYPPFRQLIAQRVREENWEKRRGIIMLRLHFIGRQADAEVHPASSWIERAASLSVEGVFRNIVLFW